MTDNDFDKKVGDSLRGYSERPPHELFSRIEDTLAGTDAPYGVQPPRRRRMPGLYRYGIAAALLIGVTLAGIYFLMQDGHNPGSLVTHETGMQPADLPSVTYGLQVSDAGAGTAGIEAEATLSTAAPSKKSAPHIMENDGAGKKGITYPRADATAVIRTKGGQPAAGKVKSVEPPTHPASGPEPRNAPAGRTSGGRKIKSQRAAEPALRKGADKNRDDLLAQGESVGRLRARKVSASFYAGNFGAVNGDSNTSDPDRAASAGMLLKQASDGNIILQSGLREEDGKPLLLPAGPVTEDVRLQHRMPLNLGLSLSIPLNGRLAITTGISYSYLYSSSTQSFSSGNVNITRELHYIGLPAGLAYTFYRAGNFGFYVQGGAMAEKGVAWRETVMFANTGDRGRESTLRRIGGFQFSVNASFGISYDFSKHVGLYIEPGISYYFENKSQPASYRTVHPASFSIKAGVKFGI